MPAQFRWQPRPGREFPHLVLTDVEPLPGLVEALRKVGWRPAGDPDTAWPTLGRLMTTPSWPGVSVETADFWLVKVQGRCPTPEEAALSAYSAKPALRAFGVTMLRPVKDKRLGEGG